MKSAADKLIKNKIANGLHFYRNCKDAEAEIENSVNLIFKLMNNLILAERAELASKEAEIKKLQNSMVKHFNEIHLEGDGPKIDRLERKLLSQASTIQKMREGLVKYEWREANSGDKYCVECLNWKKKDHKPFCELKKLIALPESSAEKRVKAMESVVEAAKEYAAHPSTALGQALSALNSLEQKDKNK